MRQIFEIRVEREDLVFVTGRDGQGRKHMFFCDGFEAVFKLMRAWVEKGYELMGDRAFAEFVDFHERMEMEEEFFEEEGG